MEEKLYLFNPFQIKNKTEVELKNMYESVMKQLNDNPNTMFEYSHNVEVYSNLNYINGEIIARLTRDVIELKMKIKVDTAINTTNERKHWVDGKPPAMSYFEGIATRMSEGDINKLADKECSLARFKNAYNSIEEKMNALKRRIDAIRYEEFNQ